MLSPTASLILVVVLGSGILFFAFKWGFVGGGGAGAYREKNPFNFWLGVIITAACVLIAVIILIGILVQPDKFCRYGC
jgi:hypothetical protein